MEVTAIWLQRRGAENDPHATVVVSIEVDGVWRDVIEEHAGSCFSHIVEENGMRNPS